MGAARVRLVWEPGRAEFRMRIDGTGGRERTVARLAYEIWHARAFEGAFPTSELLARRLPGTVTDAILVTEMTDLIGIDGTAGWLLREASGMEAFQWPWMWVAAYDDYGVLPELPDGGGYGMPVVDLRRVPIDTRELERQIRKRVQRR